MKTRDLKSLSETIASVVDPIDKERAQMLQEGFLNSLTEKARQVYSSINEEKDEDEKEESPAEEKAEDKAEMLMKRLAAKALKRAKKKAATNEEVELAEKPTSKKKKAKMDEAYPTTYVPEPKPVKPEPKPVKPKKKLSDYRSKPYPKLTNEDIELAEKAAPGYEDWASDPKVKASFKKQYGKRWKEVMYGHSWNLAKQEKKVGLDEETLDEAVSAKRMRIIRKYVKGNKRVPEHLKDYMERSFKKKRAKDAKLSDGRGAVGALETRMRRKSAALRARGIEPKGVAPGYLEEALQLDELSDNLLFSARYKAHKKGKTRLTGKIDNELIKRKLLHPPTTSMRERENQYMAHRDANRARLKAQGMQSESTQLDEAGYKKLMRVKGAAYKAELASRGADPNTSLEGLVKTAKLKRAAAEQTAKIAAGMARRGGASPDAVRGGGSRIGKSGKYTQKAGSLANQRDKALQSFRSKVRTAELFGRETDKGAKRERQQAQAAFEKKARTGDFGQDNQASLRARSNFQKRYGRLKGK